MDRYEESTFDDLAFDEADDSFDEADDGFDEEAFDELIAQALGAEDADKFFGKIVKGLRGAFNAMKKAVPTIGNIARTIASIASMIPAVGSVANVVGKLMADEALDDEGLDAFAELAVRNPAARPLLAALAARKVLGARAAHIPLAQRPQAVHAALLPSWACRAAPQSFPSSCAR